MVRLGFSSDSRSLIVSAACANSRHVLVVRVGRCGGVTVAAEPSKHLRLHKRRDVVNMCVVRIECMMYAYNAQTTMGLSKQDGCAS